MRLDGQEKQMQCHSHTVGHEMKCNETGWSRKTNAVSLTYCRSWDKMQWDWMVKINAVSLTLCWSWDEMQWDWMVKKTNAVPLTYYWSCNETGWSRKTNAVSLTPCWSWVEMQWESWIVKKNKCSVTHPLLVMGWNAMRLHGKEKQLQWYLLPVVQGMRCSQFVRLHQVFHHALTVWQENALINFIK